MNQDVKKNLEIIAYYKANPKELSKVIENSVHGNYSLSYILPNNFKILSKNFPIDFENEFLKIKISDILNDNYFHYTNQRELHLEKDKENEIKVFEMFIKKDIQKCP